MARAGFGKTIITPPLGVELCGYGVFLERRATTVHDDLFVRALLLEDDGGERVLLLALDLVGLGEDVDEEILRRAAAATGLAGDHVLVSCVHTHSGPATAPLLGWGVMQTSYVATLPDRCAEAAMSALQSLSPARLGSAHGSVRALGFNRVRHGGPLDPALHVLRIDSAQGEPRVVLYSHGCHPVTIDRRSAGGTAISADWPGQVARRLHEEGYGESIFRLGPCGDVDPVVAWHNFAFEGMALSAELVTQSLLTLLRTMETGERLALRVAQHSVSLPLQPLTEQDVAATLAQAQTRYGSVRVAEEGVADDAWPRFYAAWAEAARAGLAAQPDQISATLAGVLINGKAWLHLPGEVFTSLSDRIRASSPVPRTVVTTLARHFIGYIPDREDFAAGGYASTLTPRILQIPPYSPAVGDVLVDGAVQLLHRLGGHG
jgi:hypothetical protein